jgi:hypothetical protein
VVDNLQETNGLYFLQVRGLSLQELSTHWIFFQNLSMSLAKCSQHFSPIDTNKKPALLVFILSQGEGGVTHCLILYNCTVSCTVTMPIPKFYNTDFFKTWSTDMAYILGFMYADGNITETKRGTHFVAIYTADRDILVLMKHCFQSEHKISEIKSVTGSVYRIQIGSKE